MFPHMWRVGGLSLEMGGHHLGGHGVPLRRGAVISRIVVVVAPAEVNGPLMLIGAAMLKTNVC